MRVLSVVSLILVASWAWALPPIPETLDRADVLKRAAAVERKDAPDAQTLDIAQTRYVEYAPDGSDVMWIEYWSKALTEKGAEELRDIPVWYQEGFSEAEFQLAEVVRADGTTEAIDLRANVRAATANSNTSANIYDETTKRLVLTVPRLLRGEMLHVILARRTIRSRIPNSYTDFETFESFSGPTPYSALTIVAPASLPLRKTAVLGEIPGTMTSLTQTLADGRTRHRWIARSVPQSFPEDNMPDESTQLQRVIVSTFASWEDLSKWYWNLSAPHLKTTPAIDEKVRELTEGKSREEQIASLFGFVAQGIRYMGIIAEDKAPGFEPHDVALTFENRYGVCRDKGALLVAMLRQAGFDAFPVIINAGAKRDKEVPVPYFNHAVVAIDDGTKQYQLLDPTDDTARAQMPAYLSDCTYLVARPEGDTLRLTPVPPPEENLMRIQTEGDIDATGTLSLRATLDFGGMNDNAYRPLFVKLSADRVRDRFDGILKSLLPGAELVSFSSTPKDPKDISQPLAVSLSLRVPGYATADDAGHVLLDLPFLSQGFGLVNFLLNGLDQPKRKYAWEISSPCAVQESLTLRGVKRLGEATLLPEGTTLTSEGASYALDASRSEDLDALVLTRRLALTQKTYTPQQYLALRKFSEKLDRLEKIRPLFVKDSGQDNDAEVLLQSNAVTLQHDGTITSHTIRDVRILTFQGKRANGEAKLSYNPAYQTLTLNAAEVRSASGDVVSVTKKEINELDADGAALTPRYPAFKQRVISLPAIEVGSVSHLDYQKETRDSRPFAESVVFSSTYPIRKQVYSLTVPLSKADDLRIAERHFGDADVSRSVVTNGTSVAYTWTFRNLPPLRPEPATPSPELFLPTLHIALRDAAAYRVYPALIQKAEDVIAEGSDEVTRVAKALAKDNALQTLDDRLRAVQTFVAHRIRPLGPSWASLPFGSFSAPDRVLADGYANRMDTCLLRLALLRALGVEGELVFLSDDSLANAFTFRDAIAARDVPRWTRWTRPYIRLADGRLVGDEDEFDEPGSTSVTTRSMMSAHGRLLYEQPDALRARTQQTLRIVVQPNGDAVLAPESFTWGLLAGALRKVEHDITPELRRRAISSLAESLAPGATPVSEYIVDAASYPVRVRLAVEAKGYATKQGRLLSIPIGDIVGSAYGLRGVTRENPVWQGEAQKQTNVVDVWLPRGSEIVSKPEPFSYTLPGGGGITLACQEVVQPVTGWVRLTYTLERASAPALLDRWLYPAMVELDRRLNAPSMRTIVIRLPE